MNDQKAWTIPDGVTVQVHWCGGCWPVEAIGDVTLRCHKGLVTRDDELLVEYIPGMAREAIEFVAKLAVLGWHDVKMAARPKVKRKSVPEYEHEYGCPVG